MSRSSTPEPDLEMYQEATPDTFSMNDSPDTVVLTTDFNVKQWIEANNAKGKFKVVDVRYKEKSLKDRTNLEELSGKMVDIDFLEIFEDGETSDCSKSFWVV